jgi:predicted ATPase
MAKIVGISGAHGSGKSTLLSSLKDRGWVVDDFKVSRAVQAQLGWSSLDRVMDDVQTMMTFQEEVITQKLDRDRELKLIGTEPLYLTERTFADIASYTSHWCWEHVDRGSWELEEAVEWLHGYLHRCRIAQDECYDGVVLVPYMQHVIWQDDPNRANPSFRESFYEDVMRFTDAQLMKIRRHEIKSSSVIDRVVEVEAFLRSL